MNSCITAGILGFYSQISNLWTKKMHIYRNFTPTALFGGQNLHKCRHSYSMVAGAREDVFVAVGSEAR
jgi:hypothetical protein